DLLQRTEPLQIVSHAVVENVGRVCRALDQLISGLGIGAEWREQDNARRKCEAVHLYPPCDLLWIGCDASRRNVIASTNYRRESTIEKIGSPTFRQAEYACWAARTRRYGCRHRNRSLRGSSRTAQLCRVVAQLTPLLHRIIEDSEVRKLPA